MKYTVETTERFEKEFKRLDRYTQRMLKSWIEKNLVGCENPRAKGKGLTANRSGQWRYRIGDYRLICAERLAALQRVHDDAGIYDSSHIRFSLSSFASSNVTSAGRIPNRDLAMSTLS